MRAWALAMGLLAGCTFSIQGTDVPANGASSGADNPSLPPSTAAMPPPLPDAATPDPTTPPPASMPDMSQPLLVGIACTMDAQCGSGLVCGKSFNTVGGVVKIPGGYCTRDCSKSPCPDGSFCGTFSFGKFCLSRCPPDPCRNNYKCCSNNGQMGCTPDDLCAD